MPDSPRRGRREEKGNKCKECRRGFYLSARHADAPAKTSRASIIDGRLLRACAWGARLNFVGVGMVAAAAAGDGRGGELRPLILRFYRDGVN